MHGKIEIRTSLQENNFCVSQDCDVSQQNWFDGRQIGEIPWTGRFHTGCWRNAELGNAGSCQGASLALNEPGLELCREPRWSLWLLSQQSPTAHEQGSLGLWLLPHSCFFSEL